MEENKVDAVTVAEPAKETTPEVTKVESPPPVKLTPPTTAKTVTKELFDKTASELAETKRQLRERMTADEVQMAMVEESRMELETLRREREVAKLELSLAKNGIENSGEIAELFAAGDVAQGIASLTKAKDKQISELKKQLTTLEQRGAMTPPVGEPNDKYAGKSLAELMQLANTDPAQEAQIVAYLAAKNKKE